MRKIDQQAGYVLGHITIPDAGRLRHMLSNQFGKEAAQRVIGTGAHAFQ